MNLSELAAGETATIESIVTRDPAVVRLMVLGLVEGAALTYIRSSFGGDPLEFRLAGSAISLRREQAVHFDVRPLVRN
jgi:Fe2+ transport system protein FeoA